jgi:hypothetical protein
MDGRRRERARPDARRPQAVGRYGPAIAGLAGLWRACASLGGATMLVATYVAQLRTEQPGELRVDLAYDDHDAEAEGTPLGAGILDDVPWRAFEGPFFTRLQSLLAAMVRAWLRAVLDPVTVAGLVPFGHRVVPALCSARTTTRSRPG